VKLTLPAGISTDPLNYPRPDRMTFAFAPGKELLVYEGKVGITTALDVPADFAGSRVRIEAVMRYQACNDATCLPPATVQTELLVPVTVAVAVPTPIRPGSTSLAPRRAVGFDVGAWIAARGLLVTLLAVALLGLGLNLTPCVYPLISVTVAYFGMQGRERSARVTALALIYVLGITVSFSVLGVAAALSGGVFGAALQRPPVVIGIAVVLVALALSSFGLYQLRPPAWLMRRVGGAAHGAFGAFFMGLTMGVVAAPCVGPVVLGLLVFVGTRQSVWLGWQLFFALGLGMGVPYVALATAAGSLQRLPRAGEWLVWIERLFGVALLALAGYFVGPLLPKTLGRFLLPGLVGLGGIYLGFLDPSARRVRSFRSIQRVTGIIAAIVAVWLALPQRAESAIRWQPLEGSSLQTTRGDGRPAIIDFVADWCIPCHEMEGTTFTDPLVRKEAERFRMLKADITMETEETSALTDRYAVRGVPTVIFIDSSGAEVRRLVGYVGPEEMLGVMRSVR
jgi:thiol:disulfide interchange protein DsbD